MPDCIELLRCLLCCEEEEIQYSREEYRRLSAGGNRSETLFRFRDAFTRISSRVLPSDWTNVRSKPDSQHMSHHSQPEEPAPFIRFPRTTQEESTPRVPILVTRVEEAATRVPFPNITSVPTNSTIQSNVPAARQIGSRTVPGSSMIPPTTVTTASTPRARPYDEVSISCDSLPRTSSTVSTAQVKSKSSSYSSDLYRTSTTSSNVDRWITDNLPLAEAIAATKPKVSDKTQCKQARASSPVSSQASQSSFSSPQAPDFSKKPFVSHASTNPTEQQGKNDYVWVEKGSSSLYKIPKDIEDSIKNDIVPRVLMKPLSPSTYQDFFKSLLYAEDYYCEKWEGFEMENVTLNLHEASIHHKNKKNENTNKSYKEDNKTFVAFEMDRVPQRRPFLLSRDFASVRRAGSKLEPFQGIIYRVVKSNLVLVEFGDDFHSQHYAGCKYDVKFSFNRICLKRAHQAIESASALHLKKFLFPDLVNLPIINVGSTDRLPISDELVARVYSHHGPSPCLVVGELCICTSPQSDILSRTGKVISEAILKIYRTQPHARVLICAPTNRTCDAVTGKIQQEIPKSAIFRANAAFREIGDVPSEILPSCRHDGDECFSVPSLTELKNFRVIVSTYMSCFRLHNEGLVSGHFSKVFMLDASSTTEPELMVALTNLVDESTDVIVTGAPWNRSCWIRSDIARKYGLSRSYFERLSEDADLSP